MSEVDQEVEVNFQSEDEMDFGEWLKSQMDKRGIKIAQLAELSGITYPGIWNIVQGNTKSPQKFTRDALAKALQEKVPEAVEQTVDVESNSIAGYQWVDFTPMALETVPEQAGVYVFYDVTDRPVYVGQSKSNVRLRVKDHQTRFWFKSPLVTRGAFLSIKDPAMCTTIEQILIKFLGKHALLNSKGAVKDFNEDA